MPDALPLVARQSAAIAEWREGGAPKEAGEIGTATDALFVRTEQDEPRRMLWVAGSVATALREGALQPSAGLRQAFASVQREARRQFADDGFGIPRSETPLEPTRQLPSHVAHSTAQPPVLPEPPQTFHTPPPHPPETKN